MKTIIKSAILTMLGIAIGAVAGLTILIVVVAAAATLPNANKVVTLEAGSALEINANEELVNAAARPSIDMLIGMANAQRQVTLLDMLRSIESAAIDPHIELISLRMDGSAPMSLVAAHELRQALVRFKYSCDKPIYAYAEDYSQVEYYLASVADSLYIHPLGSIEWRGVAMNSLFYGDLIEHLGIEVDVFRPTECVYKSAVEPYTRNNMSPESRSQSQQIVDFMWSTIVNDVARIRKIDHNYLRTIAEQMVLVDNRTATKSKMITAPCQAAVYAQLLADHGVETEDGTPRTITLAEYSSIVKSLNTKPTGDHIAVIYADGTIGVGEDDYSGVNTRRFTQLLRRVGNDSDVKGVIIRVDSPGGGAIASDVVAREVKALRSKKPVVVSMGSVAASGGYYISAPANTILADQFTITGSIGVFGLGVDLEQAAEEHLYINSDGVVSSPSADFGSALRGVNDVERRAMMRSVNNIYNGFKSFVAHNRKLHAPIDSLSQGRVWCAEAAKQVGLIDNTGGLYSAISYMKNYTDQQALPLREWSDMPDGWMAILDALTTQTVGAMWRSAIGVDAPQLVDDDLRRLLTVEGGAISHSPLRIEM